MAHHARGPVEAAEATEEAEAILEDTYKREVEPAPAPMKSLRLRGGAPLPPGVPARGKRLSLTLQREVSSREHRSMSRGGGSVVPCYLAALHPLAAWLGRGGRGESKDQVAQRRPPTTLAALAGTTAAPRAACASKMCI